MLDLFHLLHILPRSHARNFLKKFAKSFPVGKVHDVGSVLYGHVGFAQQNHSIGDSHLMNYLDGWFSNGALYQARQVNGRHAKFVGIKGYFALGAAMLYYCQKRERPFGLPCGRKRCKVGENHHRQGL